MSSNHRKSVLALSFAAAIVFTSAKAQEGNKSKPGPLIIEEQGSFAVGGSVATTPGTFDPVKQGAFNPAGTECQKTSACVLAWPPAIVYLPEIGIRGNTHFPMSDLNNLEVADQVSKFLSEKKLD